MAQVDEEAADCEKFESLLIINLVRFFSHYPFETINNMPRASCKQSQGYKFSIRRVEKCSTHVLVAAGQRDAVEHDGADDEEGENWRFRHLVRVRLQLVLPNLVDDALGEEVGVVRHHEGDPKKVFLF